MKIKSLNTLEEMNEERIRFAKFLLEFCESEVKIVNYFDFLSYCGVSHVKFGLGIKAAPELLTRVVLHIIPSVNALLDELVAAGHAVISDDEYSFQITNSGIRYLTDLSGGAAYSILPPIPNLQVFNLK